MQNRYIYYDIVRALCVLWIISIWHLIDYLPSDSLFTRVTQEMNGYGEITGSVLGTFTFLSGLFLGRYSGTWQTFYKKRFLRFYVLFVISLISLYFTPFSYGPFISSFKQFVLSFLGLSCIILPAPSTLWYFEMLICFYLLTPLFLSLSKIKKVVFAIFLWVLFVLAHKLAGIIDYRLVEYFPFYIGGLLLSPDAVKDLVQKYRLVILVGFCVFIFIRIPFVNSIVRIFWGLGCILIISKQLESLIKYRLFKKFVTFVSTGSMVAYLFHRQLYYLLLRVGVELPICIFIIFVISYYTQLLYNKILNIYTLK